MERLLLNRAILASVCGAVLVGIGGSTLMGSQTERAILAPILGNYPDTSLPLSTNTTVTPDAPPTNTIRINVSTSTNFQGSLEADPATGVVRVTDARVAGMYTVTVKAFESGGASATKTFTLAVTVPAICNPVTFAATTNLGTGNGPRSVAIGDFNGDGKQDLATVNFDSNRLSVFLGDGDGNFSGPTNRAVGISPNSVAVGDFNGDGRQDLAVANAGSSTLSVFLGDGAGSFGGRTDITVGTGTAPQAVAVGDFNDDGKQDLAAANLNSNNVSIFLGDGAGNFSGPTNFAVGNGAYSMAVGDFNGDGKQDLVTANFFGPSTVSILLGNGAGGFSPRVNFAVGNNPSSVVVGDFNGDGRQDLAVVNAGDGNLSILLGNGAGSFGAATNFAAGSSPQAVGVGDFDGDGKQDLAVANASFSSLAILIGTGTGSFSAATNFDTGTTSRSVAVGDFNGDGKQDLVVANYDSHNVSVLLRDCTVAPTSAASRKIHGGAGAFDIDLPLPGSLGIECRTGGATNDHQLIVTYADNVTVNGNPQARVTSGTGTVGTGGVNNGGIVSVSGNIVTVPLTNVANAQAINVTLFGVNGGGKLVIPMGVLIGDANQNGAVNATDVSAIKAGIGHPVDGTNFRADVNANGVINATDVSAVKSHIGSGISIADEQN